MDFELYRHAALRILDGDAARLYAPFETEQSLFKYAPFWALCWTPLGYLPSQLGSVLWSSLTVVWVLATCWMSHRLCLLANLRSTSALAIPTVLLIVRAITEEFLQGQTNMLWGMLIAGFLLGAATQRRWRAACCLALAISLKLPALVFLPYLAIRRSWALLARVAICGVALNLLAAALLLPSQPFQLFHDWAQTLIRSGPDRAFEIGNQSLLALMGRLLRNDGYGFNVLALSNSAVVAASALVLVALFSSLFAPHAVRLSQPRRIVLDGALLTVLMVLFSPTCWVATYTALFCPMFMALALFLQDPRSTWRSLPLVTGAVATSAFSLMTSAKFWRFVGVRHINGESYVYLVLMTLPLFGLSLAWYLWHQRALLARHS